MTTQSLLDRSIRLNDVRSDQRGIHLADGLRLHPHSGQGSPGAAHVDVRMSC